MILGKARIPTGVTGANPLKCLSNPERKYKIQMYDDTDDTRVSSYMHVLPATCSNPCKTPGVEAVPFANFQTALEC